jgi:hypothetical protein
MPAVAVDTYLRTLPACHQSPPATSAKTRQATMKEISRALLTRSLRREAGMAKATVITAAATARGMKYSVGTEVNPGRAAKKTEAAKDAAVSLPATPTQAGGPPCACPFGGSLGAFDEDPVPRFGAARLAVLGCCRLAFGFAPPTQSVEHRLVVKRLSTVRGHAGAFSWSRSPTDRGTVCHGAGSPPCTQLLSHLCQPRRASGDPASRTKDVAVPLEVDVERLVDRPGVNLVVAPRRSLPICWVMWIV